MKCEGCSKTAIVFGFGQTNQDKRTRFMGLCIPCARQVDALPLTEDPINPWGVGDGNKMITKAPMLD